MKHAIDIRNVDKTFRIPQLAHGTLRGRILHPFQRTAYNEYEALRDVSFSVEHGEFFGIIGHNGSGKSTLLKMIAGIYHPDSGNIDVDGSVAPFIELGVGFNPELSGRDNVFINGALLGLSQARLRERFPAIVEFAELDGFMDLKLRNFSSGMQVRLAFSIALEAGADILLTDEVLAVGDARFQRKCFDVFRARKEEGRTVVLVSHDLTAMINICDRSALLHEGRIEMVGDTRAVVDCYQQLTQDAPIRRMVTPGDAGDATPARVDGVEVLGTRSAGQCMSQSSAAVQQGSPLELRVQCSFGGEVEAPIIGVLVRDQLGRIVYMTNSMWQGCDVGACHDGDRISVTFAIEQTLLAAGSYAVTAGIVDGDPSNRLALVEDLVEFEVEAEIRTGGVVDLPTRVTVERSSPVATE